MAVADNEIIYEIKAKIDDLNKKLDVMDRKAKEVGGKSGGIGQISSALAKIGPIAAAAGAAYVSYFVTNGIRKGIEAAQVQEDAVNRLNQSLMSAGSFSREASQDMQEFARSLQLVTTTGDEVILNNLAFARTFAQSNQQAKAMTAAALDLAAATGMSMESAIRNLGKSLSGLSGELGEAIGEIRNLTAEQLKGGAAIELVSNKFAGFAQSQTRTFSGAIAQLTNSWGDFLETVGEFITQSPSLVAAIKFINKNINGLSDFLSDFKKTSGDIFKPILIGAIDFAGFINSVFGPVLNFGVNVLKTMVSWVGNLAGALINLASGNFSGAFDSVKAAFSEGFEGLTNTFEFQGVEAFSAFLNGGRQAILEGAMTIRDPVKSTLNNVVSDMKKASDKIIDYGQIIASGMATAMNNLGTALVQGGLSFGGFAKIALGFLGDFAIQLGTMIISSALAIDALKKSILSFGGIGFALAAGGALIVVGSALKAFAGGPAGAGISGAAQASQAGVNDVGNELTTNLEPEREERQANVVVNIQGNVLGDKRTLGKEIAEALNEAFEKDGVRVVGGITA